MVKGISRQVIVVQSPDPKLFEQAIFLLKDDAVREGITQDQLLKEAQMAVYERDMNHGRFLYRYGAVWASFGAGIMGLIWLTTSIL